MPQEGKNSMEIIRGDITRLQVDAVVNAANSSLLGGGGVDGAIHRAAGPKLLEECKTLGGCPTGEAKLTAGYNLPAKHVIHTVGPVWHGGHKNEAELLGNCYRNSLQLAADHRLRIIAFPAISTGVYGYPFDQAARISLLTTGDFLQRHDLPQQVTFVLFSHKDFKRFTEIFDGLFSG